MRALGEREEEEGEVVREEERKEKRQTKSLVRFHRGWCFLGLGAAVREEEAGLERGEAVREIPRPFPPRVVCSGLGGAVVREERGGPGERRGCQRHSSSISTEGGVFWAWGPS